MDIRPNSPFETSRPELLTPDHVRGLALHDITQQYGTLGLYLRLQGALAERGLDESPDLQAAIHLGWALHANDRRTNGWYNDHLMRTTIRIVDHFGIDDLAIITAAPLHDSVEDHPKELVFALSGVWIDDVPTARRVGFTLLGERFDTEVSDIIETVTNPLAEDGADSLEVYARHFKEVVMPKPRPRVLKLADFIDNGVGNHYTLGDKQQKLDRKYIDLFQLHMMGLYLPDSLITGPVRDRVLRQLATGQARALHRLQGADAA